VQHYVAAWQRPLLWRDALAGSLLFGAYLFVDSLCGPVGRAKADANGFALVRLQQLLHIEIERPLNRWLTSHPLLAQLADYEYAFGYVVTAVGLLAWVYLRRRSAFARARDSMLMLNALGIVCFALFPVTPPRLLPGHGYTDTVVQGHTWGSWGSSLVTGANQLAAMPSLHVAWALWVSVVVARTTTGRLAHWLGAAHVLLTLYVILATGNHYLVDAIGAVVVVGVSVWLVDRWYGGAPTRRRSGRIPPNDAFFLHVEMAGAPQHVGGIAVLDDLGPSLEQVRALVRDEIGGLPRFRQLGLARERACGGRRRVRHVGHVSSGRRSCRRRDAA
jgi:diacylglycerol O-acyltransferase / wax synthase